MPATRRSAAALLSIVATSSLVVACGYPDYAFVAGSQDAGDDAADDTSVVADGQDDAADAADASVDADAQDDAAQDAAPLPPGSCPGIATGQDLANDVSIQPVATPITVDGDGSEWCSLRAFVLDATACNWLEPDPLPSWAAKASARVRIVWFAGADADHSGLYLDVVVADASLHVAPLTSDVDQGASFTLYVGAVSPLTGAYDGTADRGATAFVLAPPQGSVPKRGAVDVRGVQVSSLPSGVDYAARLVQGGYELEARIPWSLVASGGASAPVPTLGQTIGLDLTLRVRSSTGSKARLLWHAGGVTNTSCPTDPLPECDDRTWRTPKLGM